MSIVKINNYQYNKNLKEVSFDDAVKAITNKQDLNLHAKIDDSKPCVLFGDIDYCQSTGEIMDILRDISQHLEIPVNEFVITKNEKEDGFITAHWSVPSYKTTIQTLKQIFKGDTFKKYEKQVDNSVYKNGLFRLPYQTTAQKTTAHEIQTIKSKPCDFLPHYIPSDAKEYYFSKNTEPEPEPTPEPKPENKINLDDIKRIAEKLISINYFNGFDMWVKLGMIINYETDSSPEGLDLFDELSQNIPGYKGKHDVTKNYYSYKVKAKPLTAKTLYKWFYEEFPDEKPKPKPKPKIKSIKPENLIDIEKPNEYYEYKKEFELKVFKLDNPVSFCIENKNGLQILNKNDLITWSEGKCPNIKISLDDSEVSVPFIKLWLADTEHRVLDDIIFNPRMPITNSYNLYKGSIYSEGQACTEDNIFFKLLKYVSNDDIAYEYFKQWIAHIVKTPYKKTNVAIVLYSEVGGIGKNAITDALCKLFENYSAHLESIEDLTKNFNSHLTNKLFIYGDEINANAKKISDKLKQIITRPKQNLEKKGIDSISLDDYSNYLFTTNNENSFKLDNEDRRYVMIRAPNVPLEKTDYDNFYKFINDKDNMNELYNFFMNYENDSYNVGTGRAPITEYKKEIIYENTPAYKQFVFNNIERLAGDCLTSSELNQEITEYAKKNYLSSNWTTSRFGIEMKKILEPYVKKSGCIKYDFRKVKPAQLKEYLFNFDKSYYNYINDISPDDVPSFEDQEETQSENPLDV